MNKPLEAFRVLSIIYGNELFGSERANLEALRVMRESGAEIYVAVSDRAKGGGAVGENARSFGFNTFEMPFGSHFAYRWMKGDKKYRKRQFRRIFTNSRLLSRRIDEIQPTHIIFSNVISFIFCGWATLRHRTPIIYRIGDSPAVDSRFQMLFWKWLVRRADHIVCVSDFIRDQVLTFGGKPEKHVSTIYNVPIQRPLSANYSGSQDLIATKRPTQFLYVGQLTEQKGVHLLVDALLEINDPSVGCWIVGGGEFSAGMQNTLRDRIENTPSETQVIFTGFVENPGPLYTAADWHIAPSIYPEPMSNTSFEAKYNRTASIVSKKGGFPEVIRHGVDGFIIENVEDHECMIHALKWARDNQSLATTMGASAYQSYAETYNHTSFLNQWTAVLRHCAKS